MKVLATQDGGPPHGAAADPGLSKADASRRIDALQEKTGRGR
ncbi:DUF3072 domain-containing protein [Falsiroseomonas stagni]|nr:DUF3072 domain-containing protein [Falsiroseomonas stagni]